MNAVERAEDRVRSAQRYLDLMKSIGADTRHATACLNRAKKNLAADKAAQR